MSDSEIYATLGATEAELDGLPNFTAVGGDWNEISNEAARMAEERIVVNLGPVHPSIRDIYYLLLELNGKYAHEIYGATGFLHTDIRRNMEYRTWMQGAAYVTHMDCITSFLQEVGYCMAAEKLLGIEEQMPHRANVIRVLLMELQHITSHLVAAGSSPSELGATTMTITAFHTHEGILRISERISDLGMNYELMRPGDVPEDTPEGITAHICELLLDAWRKTLKMETIVAQNPIFRARFKDVGVLSLSALMTLGQTGSAVKAAEPPWDLRESQLYYGYEDYEFEVPVYDELDVYNRAMACFDECYQSLRIAYQTLDKLDATEGEPVMVESRKIV